LTGLFFVHLFKDFEGIRYYKVVQHRLDEIQVLLVPAAEARAGTAEAIQTSLRRELGTAVRISVDIVEQLPLTAAGKRRIVESKLGVA
jgi:phenylacetate-CoA ligase